jgi:hypothetical protein
MAHWLSPLDLHVHFSLLQYSCQSLVYSTIVSTMYIVQQYCIAHTHVRRRQQYCIAHTHARTALARAGPCPLIINNYDVTVSNRVNLVDPGQQESRYVQTYSLVFNHRVSPNPSRSVNLTPFVWNSTRLRSQSLCSIVVAM